MNDNEIIKALECCLVLHKCENCPCDFDTNGKTLCNGLGLKIFDLINRQQAEIERLNAESQVMRNAAKVYTSEINCLREEIKNLETTSNSFVSPKNTEV